MSQTAPVIQPFPSADAYAVYSAVIPLRSRDVLPRTPRKFVIVETTFASKSPSGCFPGKYRHEFRAAFSNFQQVNRQSWQLQRRFQLPHNYHFITDQQLAGMRVSSGRNINLFSWDEFYRRFPESGGYFVLSGVGFNPSRNKAVVTVALRCGPLCAGSTDYLLEKRHGNWVILPVRSSCATES